MLLSLKAEYEKNVCRESLYPTEGLALAARIRAIEEPEAEKRQAASRAKPGQAADKHGVNLTPRDAGKTREKIADAIGVSTGTLSKMQSIDKAAKAAPEKYGDLPAKMDAACGELGHLRFEENVPACGGGDAGAGGEIGRATKAVTGTPNASAILSTVRQFGSCSPLSMRARADSDTPLALAIA